MSTPTPEQMAYYEALAGPENHPGALHAALRHLIGEVKESHAHRAAQAQQLSDRRWDMWADINTLVHWLNTNNGRHYATDHEMAMRLMKLGEEVGEVMQAYIGMTGQNPRKGVTHTKHDVCEELCDVIVTAAVALNTLTGNRGISRAYLASKLGALLKRVQQPAEGITQP